MSKVLNISENKHFWHIVTPSPWPLIVSFLMFSVPLGVVTFLQGYSNGLTIMYTGLMLTVVFLFIWFSDVMSESTFEGWHSSFIQSSLVISFLLFIFSEVMFFAAFFWGYFHSSMSPTLELGLQWPPMGMKDLIFSPGEVPLLNTLMLLLSGATITVCHLYMKENNEEKSVLWLVITIALAELFLAFQYFEYSTSAFDLSDGIYGSTFFLCTGFHGFHVIIGTIFLNVCVISMVFGHFSQAHHFGFEAAAWYWHFVDVVWLFLFTMIYYWGFDMVYPVIKSFEV